RAGVGSPRRAPLVTVSDRTGQPDDVAVARAVAAVEADLIALRRDLHAHPEPAWEGVRTTQVLRDRPTAHGIATEPGEGTTGLIACVGGTADVDGPLVALRADIDALRMDDAKDVPYRSTVPGVCHACG